MPRPNLPEWGFLGAAAAFIGLTCWWLTQDRSIPVYDAGYHLGTAIRYHDQLQGGHLIAPFTHVSQYPPLGHLVGALAAFIGGVSVASPIVGENLVWVSLLALGCYQTARLCFGRGAGLIAALFALGSPLLIAQFHVFMLDAPETAAAAVSMWLLLASEAFGRTRYAAWAGLAVGVGLLVKVQFPFYVVGIVLVALARGGWRHWRGLLAFAAIAFVVAAPWYLYHLSELHTIANIAGSPAPGANPSKLSWANLSWYLWTTLNSLLLAPLFVFALVGLVAAAVALRRGRIAAGPAQALLAGAFLAWLAITLTPDHDVRFAQPLLPYLAVIGTGWIVHLKPGVRLAATGVLVLAVAANTLATTFGVGGTAKIDLVSSPSPGLPRPNQILLYSDAGFLVDGPKRDGDVPGLFAALRRNGVRVIAFGTAAGPANFSKSGLVAVAEIAGLKPSSERVPAQNDTVAGLLHSSAPPSAPLPCTRLSDGSGVWIVRYETPARRLSFFCPYPRAHYDQTSAALETSL